MLGIESKHEDGIYLSKVGLKKAQYIIYTSYRKELMQDAFSKNVIGFILKDDTNDRIAFRLNDIFEKNIEKQIKIRCEFGNKNIPIPSIYKVARENRKIYFHLSSTYFRVYDITLSQIYDTFSDDFFFTDRSILLNISHVKSFKGNEILLDNNKVETISRRKRKLLRIHFIDKLLKNHN